jgi:hypothetical protein
MIGLVLNEAFLLCRLCVCIYLSGAAAGLGRRELASSSSAPIMALILARPAGRP